MKSFKQYVQEQQEEYVSNLIQESKNFEWQSFDSVDDFVLFLDPTYIIEGRDKNQNNLTVKGVISNNTSTRPNSFKVEASNLFSNNMNRYYQNVRKQYATKIAKFLTAKQENPHLPYGNDSPLGGKISGSPFKEMHTETGHHLFHYNIDSDARLVYQIIPNNTNEGNHTHTIRFYSIDSHDRLGIGQPTRIDRMRNNVETFKNMHRNNAFTTYQQ